MLRVTGKGEKIQPSQWGWGRLSVHEASELEAFHSHNCAGAPGNIRWWRQRLRLWFAEAAEGAGCGAEAFADSLAKGPSWEGCLFSRRPTKGPQQKGIPNQPFWKRKACWWAADGGGGGSWHQPCWEKSPARSQQ